MSKILIFIFDNMTDYEITLITHLLGADAGFNIVPIAYEDKIIKSRSGLMYKPLKTVSDILKEFKENGVQDDVHGYEQAYVQNHMQNDVQGYEQDYVQDDVQRYEQANQKDCHKGSKSDIETSYCSPNEKHNDNQNEKHNEKHIENIDGIIITGGWYGETKPELLQLINKIDSQGKLVAGICGAGTVFLAKSGILENKKYTTPITEWTQNHIEVFGSKDPFPRNNYISERVVRDGNIITAQGNGFIDFTIEICDWFNLFEDNTEKENFYRCFQK